MTDRAPCYYCKGEGSIEVRRDVDVYEGEMCSECEGTGESSRRAGGRYTGPSRVNDAIQRMASLRSFYLSRKRIEAARPADWVPSIFSPREQSAKDAYIDYMNARMRAMRPCSGLAQADMLAMAARCVNRIGEMRKCA